MRMNSRLSFLSFEGGICDRVAPSAPMIRRVADVLSNTRINISPFACEMRDLVSGDRSIFDIAGAGGDRP